MPTGYTSELYDGKEISFREFVLNCSRAMGAMIHMRDDAHDAPLREDTVSSYYPEAVERATAQLETLRSTGLHTAEAAATLEYEQAVERYRQRRIDRLAMRDRYEAMLTEVQAWEPPTSEHVNFKQFMVDQLRQSIEHDCGGLDDPKWDTPPVRRTGAQWLREEIASQEQMLARAQKGLREETDRVNARNQWARDLMNSLPS